jgi:hypothetical protein
LFVRVKGVPSFLKKRLKLSGAPEAVPGSVFTLLGLVPFAHHNSFLNKHNNEHGPPIYPESTRSNCRFHIERTDILSPIACRFGIV